MAARYLTDWPGKSAPTVGGQSHPAVYHMLDVAAVAERLIAQERFPQPLEQALILLAALHDLGKIGARFRRMLNEGASQGRWRHWHVTEALLGFHHDLLMQMLGGDTDAHFELYAATSGHHGRPPSVDAEYVGELADEAGPAARADSAEVIAAFGRLWPAASLEGVDLEMAQIQELAEAIDANGLQGALVVLGTADSARRPARPTLLRENET